MNTIKPWNCPITRARQVETIKRKARQHKHMQPWFNKIAMKATKEATLAERMKARMEDLRKLRVKATA